jgi:hypothetical protein
MLRQKYLFLPVILIFLCFSGIANAKLLFRDDFEGDTVGDAPKNLEKIDNPTNAANFKVDIVKDPEGKSGKVAHTFNYALWVPKSADRDNWADYVWEWDWMWKEKGFPGTAFRITGTKYYHISPRDDNNSVGFWYYDGAWNQIGALLQYDFGFNVWNRFQVTAKGNKISLKIKRRDDEKPFANIDPILEATDDKLKKGSASVCGTNTDAWMDNFIIAEAESELSFAVEQSGKLATMWGQIKDQN